MHVYLIKLQRSSKDSLYSSESIYILLLQEEPDIEGLQLHLHGAHKADHENPEKHSQQVRETYRDCFINKHMIGKVVNINHLLELK